MNENTVLFLKTLAGEDILGTFADLRTDGVGVELIFIHFPVRLEQNVVFTPGGLYTNYIPTLYAPYGESNTVAFKKDNFQVITTASDFNHRYYEVILGELLTVETKRILMTSSSFDRQEYSDQHIHAAPETIQ